ncbi:ABC transporter permease [Streptomonospora nanhaiensis]|uniref:ABC transporter permease n=1 Tax=Streptomonospora nanhaiensis TaxID=1323731 RepID=UPI001C9A1231|nr:ABC transporter permease subunit [Streptomonospora nanhaiensis]MBX9389988.1 ABC transporter permease subunit [Streptomonospora nanhaiensis]
MAVGSASAPAPPAAAGPPAPSAPPGPADRARRRAANRWVLAAALLLVLGAGFAAARILDTPAWLGAFPAATGEWLTARLDSAYAWIVANRNTSPLFLYGFNYVSVGLGSAVVLVNQALTLLTWPGVVVLGVFAAWRAAGWRVALLVLAAFASFALTGLWNEAMTTLALIITSVLIALAVGVPLGVLAGLRPAVDRALRPVLDFLQIMPAFAYLMPMLLLFGIGNPAAAVATVLYAVPPAVRITALAVRGVDPGAVEAGTSLGSTPWQLLTRVRLPMAWRTIMLGVNQTIMLAVSMVVIASVIGAGGLGDAIYQALSKVNVGQATEAGAAIVLMAIALDRVTGAAGEGGRTPAVPARWRTPVLAGGLAAGAAAVAAGHLAGVRGWPPDWSVSVAQPLNSVQAAAQSALGGATGALGDLLLRGVLNPLSALLTGIPWWLVVLVAAGFGFVFAGARAALTGGLAVLATGLLGVWDNAMDTLSQVLVAAAVTVALGVALGVLAARRDLLAALLRPVLDTMQTLPPFVYLIPAVALFGAGRVPALAAAVVFALPPVVRLVNDGIRGVDPGAVEAAVAQGSTPRQLLTKVQLPLARPALLLAVNQGIMMVLAMVVMGALVGAGSLGYDVVFGLKQNQLGLGLTSGVAIVCLGLLLDRVTQGQRTAHA